MGKKGVIIGIIAGLICLAFPFIMVAAMKPCIEEMMVHGMSYEEAFKGLGDWLLAEGIDSKIPAYGFLPFAAYCFVVGAVAPLILDTEEDVRAFARIFLVCALLMLVPYCQMAHFWGKGNFLLPIINLVFILVAIGFAICKNDEVQTRTETAAEKVIIIIFTNK